MTIKPLTTEEFRARIRALVTGRPADEITGAPHAHPCLVRTPADKGYYPPAKPKQKENTK